MLCIDDDADALDLLYDLLTSRGYAVTLASSAGEGRALLEVQRFDAVITDYELPDGSGMDMVRSARRDGLLRETPVMLCSGRPDPPRDRVTFVQKPLRDLRGFLAKLGALCVPAPA